MEQWTIWSMWALLGLFPVALLAATRPLFGAPKPLRQAIWGAVGAGTVLRFIVPGRWVMYYTGYGLFDGAVLGSGHGKYGPSTYALHHAVQSLTGPSMDAYLATNRLLSAAIPAVLAALCRVCGLSWRAAAVSAWLAATTPLLVTDAATETQLVPVTLWLFIGLTLLGRRGGRPQGVELILGLATLTLAIFGRPEMAFVVPFALFSLAMITRPSRRFAAVYGVTILGVAALRLWTLSAAMDGQGQLGNTPKVFEVDLLTLAMTLGRDGLVRKSLLWRWDWLPTMLPVLALLVGRRRFAWWWLPALVGSCVATVDLPLLSLPRLHAPFALWLCLLAAGAVERSTWSRKTLSLAVCMWLCSCAVTLPNALETHLDDAEHALISAAVKQLQKGDVIGRRVWSDSPSERLHLHWPNTALAARAEVVDLTTLASRAGQPATPGRHLALLGTRCWMRSCDAEGEHPACARLRRRFRLTPLIERRVQAPVATLPWPFADEVSAPPAGRLRDLDFPWCVARGPMTIGLYRLEPRR